MKVNVVGSNMDVGESLTEYVTQHLTKDVKKYFENAIQADVHFSKEGSHLIKALITVNEGVKGGGINVKSNAEGTDPYGSFNEALSKAAKQLRRYKRRLKNYRRQGGIKNNATPNFEALNATKYVIPPLKYDSYAEMEEGETINEQEEATNFITTKSTEIEKLSVNEAIMKMDLADLPALVFINKENGHLNAVYHRKDGNISWIDPEKK